MYGIVDKSWRKGLQNHVESKEKQAEVYTITFVFSSRGKCWFILTKTATVISWPMDSDEGDKMSKLLEYFQREYVQRVEQWAPCYRSRSLVNTNITLEAFHCLIKVCYLERKQNRRVDYLLHVLLKVASGTRFLKGCTKTEKGKSSYALM